MRFAQFERETIAERTKDKVLATRRRGGWTGGRPTLGLDIVAGKLVINEAEAPLVRQVFDIYFEHDGLVSTMRELDRRGIRTKYWVNKHGKTVGGAAFTKDSLRSLLTNPVLVGRIRAGDDVVDGQHEAIVDKTTFDEVARALAEHRHAPGHRRMPR